MQDLKKVMIVEDDPLLSIVEEKMVTKLGYNVVGKVKSGEEALDKFGVLNPSIVLMDVQLSGMLNGIETVRSMRKRNISVPVIFLSGDASPFILNQVNDIEYTDFLRKPVIKEDLLSSLTDAEGLLKTEAQYAA